MTNSERREPTHERRGPLLLLRVWLRRLLRVRRRRDSDGPVGLPALIVCVTGLFVATGALVWFAYVAMSQWRSGTTQLLERRANEALALTRTALIVDMRGASTATIVPSKPELFNEDPVNLLQITARVFARFPYPESFLVWRAAESGDGVSYVFNRADRLPPWSAAPTSGDPFPVVLVREPPELRPLVAEIRRQTSPERPFLATTISIGSTPYQIIARSIFAPTRGGKRLALAAFTVNLTWMRAEYFGPLIEQVAKIGGHTSGVSVVVKDDGGSLVASTGSQTSDASEFVARFPLLFLDPALLPSRAPQPPSIAEWTLHVRSASDSGLLLTLQGARRMLLLIALAAGFSLFALVLTVKADRASAMLASMKSDFVAAVTHDLKTPVSFIRLVGDTLATGRYSSPATVQEYAKLLSEQATRLSASIDGLLAYSRYNDLSSIELSDVAPADLIEDALQPFRPTLEHLAFDLAVDVGEDLPAVSVDRAAMMQAIDNVVDNAVKYSNGTKMLAISGRRVGRHVCLTFRDRGSGIPPEDLAHVFEQFYRGRNVSTGGSGLGLTLAQRIVERNRGHITMRSTVGVGTEVDIVLPCSQHRQSTM